MTLILKLTDQCNLRCKYCSVGKKDNPAVLDEENIKLALDQFAHLSACKYSGQATVIFHGGEPATLSADMYDRVIQCASKSNPYVDFRWCMQTNGTILNSEWIEVIKKHDISIGVSLDGNREIHNKNRVYKNGRGSYDNVVKNIKIMLRNDIKISALFVYTGAYNDMTVENVLGEIFELGIPLKINPLVECGMASGNNKITSKGYADFLADVFRYITDNNIAIPINPIDDLFNAMLRNTVPHECVYSMSCGSRFIAVDQYGDIYPCGKYSDLRESSLGNIASTTLISAADSQIMRNLSRRRAEPGTPDCASCKYLRICNSGCPAVFDVHESKKLLCDEYKNLYYFLATTGVDIYLEKLLRKKEKDENVVYEAYKYPFSDETTAEIMRFEQNNMSGISQGSQSDMNRSRHCSAGEIFIVARKRLTIIGLLSFLIDESGDALELKTMQITPEYQLTYLFKEIIRKAYIVYGNIRKENFSPNIVRLSVHASNKYAMNIYQKLGFTFDEMVRQDDLLVYGQCSYNVLMKRIEPLISRPLN